MGTQWWFGAMPWIVGWVWIIHAVLSWYRPRRIDPVGWLLLAGLPVASLAMLVVQSRLSPRGGQPGDALLPPGFDLVLIALEVGGCWLVVMLLESVLSGIRHLRRTELRQTVS